MRMTHSPFKDPARLSRLGSLRYGLSLPWKATRLIFKNPVLLAWSLIPIMISFVLYGLLFVKFQTFAILSATQWFTQHGLDPQGWILMGATFILKLAVFVVAALCFSWAASILACPFNDLLAKHTEPYTTPSLARVPSQSLKETLEFLIQDLVKSFAATVCGLIALILWWIPGFNLLIFIITFLLVTFQYISYPQSRRGEGLGAGLRFLYRHTYACIGFGAVQTGLFCLPFAFLFMPLAVVSGTLLYARSAQLR